MASRTAYLAADGFVAELAHELGEVEFAHERLLLAAGAAATGGVGAECLARSGGNPGGVDRRRGKAAARDPA